MKSNTASSLWSVGVLIAVSACSSPPPAIVKEASDRAPRLSGHLGPPVDAATTGTARFVEPLLSSFDIEAAMAIGEYADGFRRSPASEGYEHAIDHLLGKLYGAGFGSDPGFELDIVPKGMPAPAWTPRSAQIIVIASAEAQARGAQARGAQARGGGRGASDQRRLMQVTLLEFNAPSDVERAMLPVGAPSCDVTGLAVFSVDDVVEGSILVTDKSVRSVERPAVEKGAIAVISSFLLPYCIDPTGGELHHDAIFLGTVRPGATLPSFYVSPRVAQAIRRAAAVGGSFRLVADVETKVSVLRTIVATIRGSELPDEYVAVITQVDGSGANDNAVGIGGIVELARTVKRLIDGGQIERPLRSIRFVFGQESGAGKVVLDEVDGTPVAAIVADMMGASYERTGAVCLLERGWDPGALVVLPPDTHTPWGAGEVVEEDIIPNGLSIIVREAFVDVGLATAAKGSPAWTTREHPWEGGESHDSFLARGVAAVLVWHFTDFAYQTSLDRMGNVDPAELQRTSVAVGAAALAVADARPADLERHLDSLNLERRVRLEAVARMDNGAGESEGMDQLWRDWFDGARFWLRALTAGEELPEGEGLRALDSFSDEGDEQD